MSDSLKTPVVFSLGFHVLLFLVLFVKMAFFPSEVIEIKRSIRVDMVALPDKMPPTVATAPAAPEPVPAPKPVAQDTPKPPAPAKPEPKVNLKKPSKELKSSQDSAMNKLKAMSALEKIKQEQANKKAQDVIKGNQISKGNSLTGLEQIEYDRYFDVVENSIRENWSIPQWLAEANLRAQAKVLVDETGHVVKKEILRSSGNDVFDSRVLAAIDESSPFPAPPDRLKGVLANRGIVFNFPD